MGCNEAEKVRFAAHLLEGPADRFPHLQAAIPIICCSRTCSPEPRPVAATTTSSPLLASTSSGTLSRSCASLVFVDYAEEPEPGLPYSSSTMSVPCVHALDADELFFVFFP